jgi:hypothetical protein
MDRRVIRALAWLALVACCGQAAGAEPIPPFVLGPPDQDGPVEVVAHFELLDINEINDMTETFEFTGILTLTWRDLRQAFDPASVGADEKIFQGAYQFNEVATGWYPQLVLVNSSGPFETNGVVLRVRPDGTSTLTSTLNAVAEVDIDMTLFPYDAHRLEAVFEVLGFDRDEVRLRLDPDATEGSAQDVRIPQWSLLGVELSVRDRAAPHAGHLGIASSLILTADVDRQSLYARRLVILPLVLIVLLSFSVFWMDQTTLADRQSISFIGILTAVAYQIIVSDQLPHISYVTLIHVFLSLSFVTMCATVVVNLVVSGLDRRGRSALGDRIDRRCRWAFPLAYMGLNLSMMIVAFTFF